jgi:hypothetical protein
MLQLCQSSILSAAAVVQALCDVFSQQAHLHFTSQVTPFQVR